MASKTKAAPAANKSETPPPSPQGEGDGGEMKAPAEPVTTHLLVTSRRDGFRRAGRPWSATPTLVAAEEFDEAQIAALLAEPLLEVLLMTAEAAEAWAKRD